MNPYEFTKTDQGLHGDDREIRFPGEITRADYIRLSPKKWFAWLGAFLIFLWSLVFAVGALMIPIAFANSMLDMTIAGIVIVVMSAMAVFGTYWVSNSTACTKRSAKRFPYLFGKVEGRFVQEGVLIQLNSVTYWWGWSAIPESTATSKGCRIQFADSPYHYFAIHSGMIPYFNADDLQFALADWKQRPALTDDQVERLVFQKLAPLEESIRVCGTVCLAEPEQRKEEYKMLAIESVSLAASPAILWMDWDSMWWLAISVAIFLPLSLVDVFTRARRLLYSSPRTETLRGWFGSEICVIGYGNSAIMSATHQVRLKSLDNDVLHLVHDNGIQWFIPRSLLLIPDRWEHLIGLFSNKAQSNRTE